MKWTLILLLTLVACSQDKKPTIDREKEPTTELEAIDTSSVKSTDMKPKQDSITESTGPPPPEEIIIEEIEEEIIDFPDIDAEFPGGEEQLNKFIHRNLEYPMIAREMGIEGTVLVQFTISKNGTVMNVHIKKSVQKFLDKAAFDVVRKLPKWQRAEKNGRAVEEVKTLPIVFKLP